MSYVQKDAIKPLRICQRCYDQVAHKDGWEQSFSGVYFNCDSCWIQAYAGPPMDATDW